MKSFKAKVINTSIPNLTKYIRVNVENQLYKKYPDFHLECVIVSIDNAIKEIVQNIVIKSVGVAISTTK